MEPKEEIIPGQEPSTVGSVESVERLVKLEDMMEKQGGQLIGGQLSFI